ncbi:putative RTA1 domain protein [Aspergillus steynii IBT 23096]|uniref:Putative RTA1 domain protein n=1 Tax=Aspergillus steynii IBT 23096 TaxID=1392250 RepID=A0A2I2GMR6_9EURO|nr:putative RTA1 domain protein [Aspergillus steynii IBT 23096]PLB54150.1 putative RTA1 domain protein [Aspergillus steynii IBT 23096]
MGSWSLYDYEPSKPAALVAILAYALSSIYHIYQLVQLKAYFFTSFIVGAIMMTIGYISRTISSNGTTALAPYIAQNICILLPPSLYAATIYMIYGRVVIHLRVPRLSLISPYKVTKIFVVGDTIAFLTQASGGGMMAMQELASMGHKITIVGLFVFFGLFLTVTGTFVRRLGNRGTAGSQVPGDVKRLLTVLLVVSGVIIVRCLYRIVEFCQGNDGYLMRHEVLMYVFDTIPMFGVQVVFHFFHPGVILGQGRGFEAVDVAM